MAQRLADGGEAGILIGGALNVVEANDGNVFRDALTEFAKSLNSANRGNIIKGKQCGEDFATLEEVAGDVVTNLRRWRIVGELGGEFVSNLDTQLVRNDM